MKALLLICLFVVSAFGQTSTTPKQKPIPRPNDNCANCIETIYDKVTGNSYAVGIRRLVISDDGKTGFAIRTQGSNNSILLNFEIVERGAGCVDDHAAIYILFRDGSRLGTKSSNTVFNCDGDAPLYFGDVFGRERDLEELKTKPIETVRIHTLKSSVQRDFSIAQSNELMRQLRCLDAAVQKDRSSEPPRISDPNKGKKVSGGVLNRKATNLPNPAYPPAARAVRASGLVAVQVLINEAGNVISAAAVSGHPLLRAAAEVAARSAVFPPTFLSGEAVKVSGVIAYNFIP